MRRVLLIAVVLIAVLVGLYFWRTRPDESPGKAPELAGAPASASVLARGEYLARAADCVVCHTRAGSGEAYAGGVPFKLPFGTLYSTNITPDPDTGIGRWSDEDFVRAVREGVAPGGRHLYPAFPYTSYTALSRDDVLAIKQYLFSLPAIHRVNQANDLSFPFNQRWGLGLWNAVFFRSHRFVPDPAKPAAVNSGAYLAQALGHCGECHTPRNFAFALESGREFAGEEQEGWRAYNISSDPTAGIGAWSEQDLATYLRVGHALQHGSASGPMAEVVEYSLQYLDPADTAALVSYLRSVPAQAGRPVIKVDPLPKPALASTPTAPHGDDAHTEGAALFAGACIGCHTWNGQGLQTSYAALVGSRSVNDPSGTNAVQALLGGSRLRTTSGDAFMPRFGAGYSDAEIAALANFVIGHFGNQQGTVTAAQVGHGRASYTNSR